MRIALLLSTALLLAACGGGDEEKAAYVQAASGVCKEAVAEFEDLQAPTGAADVAPYAERLFQIVEGAETKLAALTPPEGDRQELETKVLEPLAELVEQGRAYVQQVQEAGTDQARLLALLSKRPSVDAIDVEYLRSYGLDACADAVEQA